MQTTHKFSIMNHERHLGILEKNINIKNNELKE
jgi:hypothetical protein